jgi:hypothetical protein
MGKEVRIPEHLKPWIEAHRRFRLSHMHIQMARELGMNPKRFGKLDNHRQEPWKAPLPIFIERIYFKRFGKERPDEVLTIRQFAERQQSKKCAKKLARLARKAAKLADVPRASSNQPDAETGRGEIAFSIHSPSEVGGIVITAFSEMLLRGDS